MKKNVAMCAYIYTMYLLVFLGQKSLKRRNRRWNTLRLFFGPSEKCHAFVCCLLRKRFVILFALTRFLCSVLKCDKKVFLRNLETPILKDFNGLTKWRHHHSHFTFVFVEIIRNHLQYTVENWNSISGELKGHLET